MVVIITTTIIITTNILADMCRASTHFRHGAKALEQLGRGCGRMLIGSPSLRALSKPGEWGEGMQIQGGVCVCATK